MQMTTFWSTVATTMNLQEAEEKYSSQLSELAEKIEGSGLTLRDAEFAFAVIPNMGPGGPSTDEDAADLDKRDPDQEIADADGPSLSGEKELMAYFPDVDELYVYNPRHNSWLMWNY